MKDFVNLVNSVEIGPYADLIRNAELVRIDYVFLWSVRLGNYITQKGHEMDSDSFTVHLMPLLYQRSEVQGKNAGFDFFIGGNKMFYVRADANSEIGTGHVMRCMSVAAELKKRGINTTFIVADHRADELIQSRGFLTHCMDTVWDDMESELPYLLEYIRKQKISHLLIDDYYVTERYFAEVQKETAVSYIDDLNLAYGNFETLLNYNIYAETMNYPVNEKIYAKNYLLGPHYAPLREEFQDVLAVLRDEVSAVLISSGGTDNRNIAGALIETLAPLYTKITFHVISGAMNCNYESLCRLSEKHGNVKIHTNVKRMSDIMCRCDLAISACGSTIYELCACGVPILTYALADNQLPGVNELQKRNMALYCGDYRSDAQKVIENAGKYMRFLIDNPDIRKRMFLCQQEEVNQKGVIPIADSLVS